MICLENEICWGDNCCPDDSDYIGCFEVEQTGFDSFNHLAIKTTEFELMTPCWCIGYCQAFNYSLAAISYSWDCFCADNPGSNTTEDSCNKDCAGDSSKKCGGSGVHEHASVFGTGL